MKKVMPVIIAIVLIFVIVGVSFGAQIIEKYSYSKEQYDLTTYFENTSESDVAIVLQDKFMDFRSTLVEGTYYVDMNDVLTYFNDRFYFDPVEKYLIYTTPTEMIKTLADTNVVTVGESDEQLGYVPARLSGDKVLVALDYVKRYTNFSYEAFTDPGRLQIYTEWPERKVAVVKKKTQVRYRGGVKSPILKEVAAGDKLIVLEEMEDWVKVQTEDAILGFVEAKRLSDTIAEKPIPVMDYVEPEYTDLCRDHKINMGWHAIAGVGGNDTLDSYVSNTKGLNVIAPTWFGLTDDAGNYYSYASADYVAKAHSKGLEVWAVLDDIANGYTVDMTNVLGITSVRQRLINSIISDALSLGLDGINIDFEYVPEEDGPAFSEFVRELSIPCRKNGIVLSIDNYVPIGGRAHYDRKTQGEVADYVVIMGYDEHYAGSAEAGSVASIDYVDKGISMMLENVPARKIVNGIPFYTRIWETSGTDVTSQAVGMSMAKEWATNHGLTPVWDEATCQNYAEYTNGNTKYQCWFEDAESIAVKLNVMDTYGIGGVAEWRLGYETPDIWDVIGEYLNK